MTKETILKKNHAKKVLNWDVVFRQNPSIIESAYKSMDDFAIKFAIWKDRNVTARQNGRTYTQWYGNKKCTYRQLLKLFIDNLK